MRNQFVQACHGLAVFCLLGSGQWFSQATSSTTPTSTAQPNKPSKGCKGSACTLAPPTQPPDTALPPTSPVTNPQTVASPVPVLPFVPWNFAVSGDSRNCGDVVMPMIAADVIKRNARFYWHLGDFRWMGRVDEDMEHGPHHYGGMGFAYRRAAWRDFIDNQVTPFGVTPVFLGIGNHEMILHSNRDDYLRTFKPWIDSAIIHEQRRKDYPGEAEGSPALAVRTYYHWVLDGVDFITLDNASDSFDKRQMIWIADLIKRDAANPEIKTLVVGMHEALPDSISAFHSMNQSEEGTTTGRIVYRELWDLQQNSGKKVYVLASHSHFYMANVFNTTQWKGMMLPGWIVGTAGAHRYLLPSNWRDARDAMNNLYGYLVGNVQSDGEIKFEFKEQKRGDVPPGVAKNFDDNFVDWCFKSNTDCKDDNKHCEKAH